MVSAKLYTTNEEVLFVFREMQNHTSLVNQKLQNYLVCKAFDSGNRNELYLICSVNDSEIWIHDVHQSQAMNYLLDVCIRMVLHHFFKLGKHEVIFGFDTMNVCLEEICIKIGFAIVHKSDRCTKISITDEQFYKNKC